jgi:predicted transcriptional regulator
MAGTVNKINVPRKKLSVKNVTESMRRHRGILADVAKEMGVTRGAVSKFITAHPELNAVLAEVKETMKDFAEGKLSEAIDSREAWAVKYYLSCQARDRGYIDSANAEIMRELEEFRALLKQAHANQP